MAIYSSPTYSSALTLNSQTLRRYYNSATLSDVTRCFSDRKVHAHKMVLIMASSYFEGAFSGHFVESDSKEMWLHEDEPDAVEGMLRHIYGLDAEDAIGNPGIYFQLRLFTVASKYDIPTLLIKATKEVKNYLDPHNITNKRWFPDVVYKIYEEVPVHKRELRNIASDVCVDNYKALLTQKDFKELILDCPTLALDIMEKMAARQSA